MLTLIAFIAQDYVLRDLQRSPVAAQGPFKLEREDCIARDPPVAVLHYAPCRPMARLIWSSSDGQILIKYEDDGGWLGRYFLFPTAPDMPNSCGLAGFTAYQTKPGSSGDWQNSGRAFVSTLEKCSRLTSLQIASYKNEFLEAAPYYGEAATSLRSLAVSMFGNLRRCTAQKEVTKNNPMNGFTCVRQEGPSS